MFRSLLYAAFVTVACALPPDLDAERTAILAADGAWLAAAQSGDVAWSFGTSAFTMPTESGGLDTLRGQGVVVWQQGADRRWRSAVDIRTATP